MSIHDQIDVEIRNQAVRLKSKCHAYFELPKMIYSQIIKDNDMRKHPYRVGYGRIQQVVHAMIETGTLS